MKFIRFLLLAVPLLCMGGRAWAFRLRLNGLVTEYSTQQPMQAARVRIYKDGLLLAQQASNAAGKYAMVLENNAHYVLRVDAPGYQGKSILVDTHGVEWQGDKRIAELLVEMRLPSLKAGIDLSYFDLPLGLARFEPATGFTRWNKTYERSLALGAHQLMEQYARQEAEVPAAGTEARRRVMPAIRL